MNYRLPIIMLLLLPFSGMAQSSGIPEDYTVMKAEVINGDTILVSDLPELEVDSKKHFANDEERYAYYRLKRNVRKVLPYARMAAEKSAAYHEAVMQYQKKRNKKQYIKGIEDELRAEFEEELKKLSVTQGKILMKLIARETGESSYKLVKDLRGGMSAFTYQTTARIFGHNLKSDYDPEGEDKMLEEVVQVIIAEDERRAERERLKAEN